MKILVVENSLIHRQAAIKTLAGHELTLAANYKQAIDCLGGDEMKKGQVASYDAVLTDMMMAPGQTSNDTFEHPFGFVIALAAANRGVKHVALLTDINHHHYGLSTALDAIGPMYYHDQFTPNFMINGAKVMFVHAPFVEFAEAMGPCPDCVVPEETQHRVLTYPLPWQPGDCPFCRGTKRSHGNEPCWACKANPGKCHTCHGEAVTTKKIRGKDWAKVLTDLGAEDAPT